MRKLLEKEFIVITGKGGVGRTTVSMVVAALCASQGRRTLLCTSAFRDSWPWFMPESARGKIASPSPNLHVLQSSPVAAREEYGLQILKNRAIHKLVFSSRHVNNFLDAVPGLAEWAILGKATWHILPSTEAGSRFDTVVLDAPATGHGLDMLRLPAAIVDSVPVGRIRDEAAERLTLLRDPARTTVIPVTLLEELPVNETAELVAALLESDFPVPFLVANRVMTDHLPGAESTVLSTPSTSDWAFAAAVHDQAARRQKELIEHLLSSPGLDIVELPEIATGISSWDDLEKLKRAFGSSFRN